MATIGIRELKAQTSAVLRRVEAGETVEITNHGRVIARIVPAVTTDEEIRQSVAILDDLDRVAQELDWPAGSNAEDVIRDVRREL
jgi:prevent-host-death family protein